MEKSSREAQRIYKANLQEKKEKEKRAPRQLCPMFAGCTQEHYPCLFLSSFYITKQSDITFLGKLGTHLFLSSSSSSSFYSSPSNSPSPRQQHAVLSDYTSWVAAEAHGHSFSVIVSVCSEGRGSNGRWQKRVAFTRYSREATVEEALTGRVLVEQKKGSERLRSSAQPLNQ